MPINTYKNDKAKLFSWILAAALLVAGMMPVLAGAADFRPYKKGPLPQGKPFQNTEYLIDEINSEINNINSKIDSIKKQIGFTKLTFNLSGGSSKSFTIPESEVPVRLDITFMQGNNPAKIMSAIVTWETATGTVSWIGTNSDGTQAASDSLQSGPPPIAFVAGSPNPAVLMVENDGTGTLKIQQNGVVSEASYVVHMWY